MQKKIKKAFSAPSIRLKTLVVLEILTLLLVSLGGLFYFTRKALVEESKKDAEQRLEGTVQHVDNVLMSIEQTAGNFYYELLDNLDKPERMADYCRKLVECNQDIVGCAIAFEPNYYPNHELFFTYVHRKSYNSPELLVSEGLPGNPYTKQFWYTETMKTCRPAWLDPRQNQDNGLEPIVTFCLPIRDKSTECVGVIAVGLSVSLLSQMVLETKPSPNSYSILLGHDGSYIVHPDRLKLSGQTVFQQPDVVESPSAIHAAEAMLEGGTGNMSFKLNDFTWYLFYKPFLRADIPGRSMEALNWSIATIYPKSDIFGEYYHLVLHVLVIVIIGFLIFFVLCRMVIRKQLKPLTYLTESAERIAEGHYDETIPDTNRDDELGIFQKHFQIMQKALAANVSKKEELHNTLNERREELRKTHQQIQEDDHVKTTFLHNVTNRMIAPSEAIIKSVNYLCDNYQDISLVRANKEIAYIKLQSDTILELLSQKFTVPSDVPFGESDASLAGNDAPTSEAGKEDRHE